MCSKGGGSPPVPNSASTAFQSTTTPAPFATPLYQDFLNRANTASQTPFNPAMLGQAAPLNAEQQAAGAQLFATGMDTSKYSTAADTLSTVGGQMGTFDPAQVRAIESPYTQDVVNATQNWFNNQNAIQGNDLLSQAIRSGNAFGGDRAGVAEGILGGQQQLAQAPVIAGLYQSGYTQALNEYNQLKQMGLAGAQAGLSGQLAAQQARLQGESAALGWGGLEQAQTQREADVAQQNAMMQSAYPFQTLNWYGAALGGVGPLLGAQTVGFNTPPEQSGLATGLGAASAAIGLGNAAFGGGSSAAAPAADAGGGRGQKRGGVVHRVRGGLVPVYIRHNGGIIPGLAFGGSSDDSDDDQHEPAGLPAQASERAQSEDYKPPQIALPPREKQPGWGSQIGQLKGGQKQTTPSTFPGMGSGTTQPQQKSDLEQGLNLATKAVPLIKLASNAILPTGAGLFFNRGGWVIPHLQDGGDTNVLSDEGPDPVSPGQRLAADYTGRTTWFNPRNERGGYTYRDDSGRDWTDTGAQRLREGPHASGLPSTTRGFATPGSSDLGNWFEVNLPGGRKTYAQKTDVGPPGVVDLNAPLASSVGYNPGNVGGRTYVRDLGRTRPPGAEGDGGGEDTAMRQAYDRYADKNEHEPAGLPPEHGNTGEPGSASTPRVPGDEDTSSPRGGSAGPGARPTPGAGTGAVGRQIPGLAKPAPTFAQRLANDPFWQFGTALMAKPGLKRYPLQGVGAAAQTMSGQQQEQRKQDILDAKPTMHDDGKQLWALQSDGTFTPTGLPSPLGVKQGQALELQAAKQKLDEKFKTFNTPYGNVTGARQPDGRYVDTETGDVLYDPRDPTKGGAGADAGAGVARPSSPAQQPPAQQQRVIQPPRQTEIAPRQETEWPDKTAIAAQPPPQGGGATAQPAAPAQAPAQQQPPAQTAQAGPGDLTAGGQMLPESDDQKQVVAQIGASGARFKTPLNVDQRLLRSMGVTPEQFDGLALRLAHGDEGILKGMGSSKAAGIARNALRARATQFYTDQGMPESEANKAISAFGAQKAGARSLAVQDAKITGAIEQAQLVAPRVLEASAKVDRTNYPNLNSLILAVERGTGDTNVVRLQTAVHALVQNYAAAMGKGNPVLTDNAARRASELINLNFSDPQMRAVVNQMMLEMQSESVGVKRAMGTYLGQTTPGGGGGQQQQQPQQQLSPEDKAAVDWARKNPQHPRSKEILQQNGLQ